MSRSGVINLFARFYSQPRFPSSSRLGANKDDCIQMINMHRKTSEEHMEFTSQHTLMLPAPSHFLGMFPGQLSGKNTVVWKYNRQIGWQDADHNPRAHALVAALGSVGLARATLVAIPATESSEESSSKLELYLVCLTWM
ncbi:hypothetical protein PM082_005734 [Marasmius tenuissimus]|nr:hypothetical protein PM082_005734 [Marasmius tenuissimus]